MWNMFFPCVTRKLSSLFEFLIESRIESRIKSRFKFEQSNTLLSSFTLGDETHVLPIIRVLKSLNNLPCNGLLITNHIFGGTMLNSHVSFLNLVRQEKITYVESTGPLTRASLTIFLQQIWRTCWSGRECFP